MLTINIFKDQLILGFVYHVVVQFYHLEISQTRISLGLNKNYIEISNKNSSVLLKAPPNLALLFNQFNNSLPEQQIDPENVMNSRYFDIDQMQSLTSTKKEKSLSFFHINACSLKKKKFDDLAYLSKCTSKNFDIIAVNETIISKKTSLTSNVKLNNHSFE